MPAPSKESVHRSMKRLFKNYVRMCRRRNVFWELTLEQFQSLTSGKCAYCGTDPAQVSRSYKYNGIDRKDNLKGYSPGNCVPACKGCNFLKGDRLSFDEMVVVAQALIRFRQRRTI